MQVFAKQKGRIRGPFSEIRKNQTYFVFVFAAISIVSRRSRFTNARSDGVSILDTKEISPFAFGEAREVVPEFLEPPLFDFSPMLCSQ